MSSPAQLSVQFAGPWLVGVLVGLWCAVSSLRVGLTRASLFGVITCQYTSYAAMYRDDHRWIRVVCAVVWVATAVKAVLDAATLWLIVLPTAGDPAQSFSWAQLSSFFVFHVIIAVTQSFFIARVGQLYRTAWIAVPAGILLAGAMGSGLHAFSLLFFPPDAQTTGRALRAVIGLMWLLVACNVYVTIALTWHLRKRAIHQRQRYILERLLRLTVSNCLLTASMSVINAILLPFNGPLASAHIPAYLLIPYAWAFSLFYTLNSRRAISLGAIESEGGSPPRSCGFSGTTAQPTPGLGIDDDKSHFDSEGAEAADVRERRRSTTTTTSRFFRRRHSVDELPTSSTASRWPQLSRPSVANQVRVSVETTEHRDDFDKPAPPSVPRLQVPLDELQVAPVVYRISLERRASDAAAAATV